MNNKPKETPSNTNIENDSLHINTSSNSKSSQDVYVSQKVSSISINETNHAGHLSEDTSELASIPQETTPLDVLSLEVDTTPLAPMGQTSLNMVGIEKNTLDQPKIPFIQSAQCCHVGAVRTRNEDSLLIIDTTTGGQIPLNNFGLYIVADGMGGHHAGHEASRRTSRILGNRILREIYIPLLVDKPTTSIPIQELMSKAIQEANETLYNPDPDKDMGTTITAALIFGERLYLAHVGDSRAYLLHDGKLELMTTDHSYVQRLQDAGQLTPEEAAVHPQRNVLYRAVGQGGQLEVEVFTRSLPPQGKLLLCSDGLWGLVPNEVLQEILEQPISLQEQTNHLVEYALEAGGYDNITVIIVDFTF